MAPSPPSKEETQELEKIATKNNEEKIAKFIEKFQDVSNEELSQKISDLRFSPEAREAAARILQRRTSN